LPDPRIAKAEDYIREIDGAPAKTPDVLNPGSISSLSLVGMSEAAKEKLLGPNKYLAFKNYPDHDAYPLGGRDASGDTNMELCTLNELVDEATILELHDSSGKGLRNARERVARKRWDEMMGSVGGRRGGHRGRR
jgi:hypothetical protein